MRISGRKQAAYVFPRRFRRPVREVLRVGQVRPKPTLVRAVCGLYAGDHHTTEHKCPVVECKAAAGRMCAHVIPKCNACRHCRTGTQPWLSPVPRSKGGSQGTHVTSARKPNKRRNRTANRPCQNVSAPAKLCERTAGGRGGIADRKSWKQNL